MNVLPYSPMSVVTPAAFAGGMPAANGTAAFGNVVQRFVQDTNAQQIQADRSVELLATGQSDGIHETMLALTKTDLTMRVFMEVRNKVIDAYQEIMRMQL